MEKRVLIAIFLSFLVLYLYQALVIKPVPKTAGAGGQGSPGSPPTGSQSSTSSPAAGGRPAGTPTGRKAVPGPPEAPAATALVGEPAERDVRIETPDVIATFTNRGGQLKSWRLKRFLDVKNEPQDLVLNEPGSAAPLPFSLQVADEAVTATLNGALYAVKSPPPNRGS